MIAQFVSEPLKPDRSFDTAAMAEGAPGLPSKFRWRKTDLVVAEVLERGKEFGDCTHGSGERYVRRHVWRIRTADGRVARISFQRSFGKARPAARWWLHGFEA
jgi:phosphoribosylglycinamide formyltransferase-1